MSSEFKVWSPSWIVFNLKLVQFWKQNPVRIFNLKPESARTTQIQDTKVPHFQEAVMLKLDWLCDMPLSGQQEVLTHPPSCLFFFIRVFPFLPDFFSVSAFLPSGFSISHHFTSKPSSINHPTPHLTPIPHQINSINLNLNYTVSVCSQLGENETQPLDYLPLLYFNISSSSYWCSSLLSVLCLSNSLSLVLLIPLQLSV